MYPDFVIPRAKGDGFTAVSSKSRVLTEKMSSDSVNKLVRDDIREALEKYYGLKFVRRRGLDVTGKQIRIDEVVLNYDSRLVPAGLRQEMQAIAKTYEGSFDLKIGFFN